MYKKKYSYKILQHQTQRRKHEMKNEILPKNLSFLLCSLLIALCRSTVKKQSKKKRKAGKNLYSCKLNLHSFTRFIFSLFYFFSLFFFLVFVFLPYELEFFLQIQCYSSCFFDGFIHWESVKQKEKRKRKIEIKGSEEEKYWKLHQAHGIISISRSTAAAK